MSLLLAAFGAGLFVGWLASRPGHARLTAELDKERSLYEERLKAYADAEDRLRDTFQAVGFDALQTASRTFLRLAESRFEAANARAAAEADARRRAIDELLAPLARTLQDVDREVRDAERRRIQHGAELLQRLEAIDAMGQNLRAETGRLVDALKRPGVRGRWGELQLRRVIELAGMLEHCDFDEQSTFDAGGNGEGRPRRLRPDVVVRLPGSRHVVIDAKAPLDAYLRALDAPDDRTRQALLADHARQVRAHLAELAAKDYSTFITPSPDFVVMFLPGEVFFSAALEQDPSLIEHGVELRVVLASPTTLIALLRAVAYGWQQVTLEQNARKISELGRSLYESVRVLGTHFETLGARLRMSVDAYNQAVGSLEGNVLVKARKLKDLQAAAGCDDIPALEPVDGAPRGVQARELIEGERI